MTYFRPLPQQPYLRECFDYNPETGTLTWRYRPQHHFADRPHWKQWNAKWAGVIAGTETPESYIAVRVNAIGYRASRIIWRLMTSEEPIEIDHINRIRGDNRWSNLRSVTHFENHCNSNQKPNRTGFTGVRRSGARSFQAAIHIGKRMVHLGSFPSAEAAHEVFCAAVVCRAEFYSS